jgi:DNA-binding transcriptional MerR regulator/methylmalonyl-CoA mutase cobalamin-binding subunit
MTEPIREQGPYKMRTIGRLTGYSPELLRAWERRHGLLEPLRGSGGHRLYTEDDLQVLLRVRDLINEGRSIGEIARFGRQGLLEEARKSNAVTETVVPATVYVGENGLDHPPPESEQWVETVVRGALEINTAKITGVLDNAFARTSPEHVISGLLLPAARQIGELWSKGKCSAASEHLATGLFVHRLRKMVEAAEPVRSEWNPVIVACFPDEYHQLGALIASYWLCRNGLRVNYLGAALPFEDLKSTWSVLEPSAVVLSVTRAAVYDMHRRDFRKLLATVPSGMPLYVGGQGAPSADEAVERAGARVFAPGTPFSGVIPVVVSDVHRRGRRSNQPTWPSMGV